MKTTSRHSIRSFLAILAGVLIGLAGTSASRGADAFALVVQKRGILQRLDITTGTHTLIRDNSRVFDNYDYYGLAFNAERTVLFAIAGPSNQTTSNSTLVRFDPTNGVPISADTCGVPLSTLTSLADGRLFSVGFDAKLYQINPNSGAATVIGSTGLPNFTAGAYDNSLASDGTTLYYTFYRSGSIRYLYILNSTTGLATPVGPTTGTIPIVGSAFAGPSFATGRLYAFTSTDHTFSINLATGAATDLNHHGLTDIYGGVGVITVVTPPPTVTLADVGGCQGQSKIGRAHV